IPIHPHPNLLPAYREKGPEANNSRPYRPNMLPQRIRQHRLTCSTFVTCSISSFAFGGCQMQYRILGRTGVKVTPLCLGTMNFGGRSDAAESGRILSQYLELGGNFIDTANVYNDGRSEEVIGTWMRETGMRDRIVLSTKVHGLRSP